MKIKARKPQRGREGPLEKKKGLTPWNEKQKDKRKATKWGKK